MITRSFQNTGMKIRMAIVSFVVLFLFIGCGQGFADTYAVYAPDPNFTSNPDAYTPLTEEELYALSESEIEPEPSRGQAASAVYTTSYSYQENAIQSDDIVLRYHARFLILQSLRNFESSVDLSSLNLKVVVTSSDQQVAKDKARDKMYEWIKDIYWRALTPIGVERLNNTSDAWDLFYAYPHFAGFSTNPVGTKTELVNGKYTSSVELSAIKHNYVDPWGSPCSINEARNYYNETISALNDVVAKVEGLGLSSEADKTKAVHDWITRNCSYDHTYTAPSYNIYGTFVLHSAVCKGYSLANQAILEKLGIDSQYVRSFVDNSDGTTSGHAWNKVKIDGEWYHEDVTWDDQDQGYNEVILTKYFLKSGDYFHSNHGQYTEWEPIAPAATNKRYNSMIWNEYWLPQLTEADISYPKTIDFREFEKIPLANAISVSHDGKTLVKGTDYKIINSTPAVSYDFHVKHYHLYIKGIGAYRGGVGITIDEPGCDISTLGLYNYGSAYYCSAAASLSLAYPYSSSTSSFGLLQASAIEPVCIDHIGEQEIEVHGREPFWGTATVTINVRAKDLNNSTVSKKFSSKATYNNGALPDTNLVMADSQTKKTLVEGADYTISASSMNVGTTTFTVKGKGNYTGTWSFTSEVEPLDINCFTFATLKKRIWNYGIPILAVPQVTGTYAISTGGHLPVSGDDYKCYCFNNTDVGIATVRVKGVGNYTGECDLSYEIVPCDVSSIFTGNIPDQVYSASSSTPIKPVKSQQLMAAYFNDYWLVETSDVLVGEVREGVDYTVQYENNVEVGTATATITGMGNCCGQVVKTFKIVPANITSVNISGISNKTYTANLIYQTVNLTYNGKQLVNGKDFSISYANNKNAGTATVVFIGLGNYSGSLSKNFVINKKANTMTAAAKATVTLKYSSTKAQTIAPSKLYTVKNPIGAVSYAKVSGNSKLTVAKNGKITVKKGTKKGTYKVKVKITAAGNKNVNSKRATVTVSVKVK